MQNFKSYLLGQGKSQQTVTRYYNYVMELLNWCEDENLEIEQLRYNDLLLYVKSCKTRGNSVHTIKGKVGALRLYFKWQIKQEIRTNNPAQNLEIKGGERKKLYRILDQKALESLYENYPSETITDKRNKVMIGLMIWQGLGSAELQRMELKDLRLKEGVIYISGSRTSNERTLELRSLQMMELMEYQLQIRQELLKEKGTESSKLFITTGSGDLLHNMLVKLVVKLKEIEPKITSLKQIRTSVITNWLKHYNTRKVQYMAGHKYVSSTEAFKVHDVDDLQDDITKYHPIN